MSHYVCITFTEGNTRFVIAELLLDDENIFKAISSVSGQTLNLTTHHCKDLIQLGAIIVPHQPGRVKNVVTSIKDNNVDTVCMILPASKHKTDVTAELIEVVKMADVPNIVLITAAGCDLAERDRQPKLGVCGFGGVVYGV